MISGASQELLELAEFLQAPVMTSQGSKGILSEDHYLAVGTNYASVGPAYRIMPDVDVLLAVGTRLLIRDLAVETPPTLVHIDADEDEIGKNLPAEVGITADARVALGALLQRLRADGPPKESRRQEIEGYKTRFAQEIRELAPQQTDIISTVRDTLADAAVVVSGVTNIGYWSNVAYPVLRPRTYVTSGYFGTLGYAFPTALGVKAARPDRQVVALCGDGGFMYNPQELSTAVKYGINVVAVVFNNNAYGASEWDQTHRYGRRFIGTDLLNPDFVELARAFGAVGMRTGPSGLGSALRDALAADAPVLLEVELPNMMPPFQLV